MTQPHDPGQSAPAQGRPNLLRWAIWVAIGALILAAIVCVIWVLVGPDNDIIGRAFLTILLWRPLRGWPSSRRISLRAVRTGSR